MKIYNHLRRGYITISFGPRSKMNIGNRNRFRVYFPFVVEFDSSHRRKVLWFNFPRFAIGYDIRKYETSGDIFYMRFILWFLEYEYANYGFFEDFQIVDKCVVKTYKKWTTT